VTTGDTLRVLAYGLIAAASPLALAATLVVLRSARARLNGFLFAATFLVGEAIVVVLVVTLGSIAAPGTGGSATVAAGFELALGLLLLAAGIRAWRSDPAQRKADKRGEGRTKAMLARLGQMTPATTCGAGTLLGIGGPKRLTVSIVAASTIAATDSPTRLKFGEAVLYIAVGGLLVWGPVAVYMVAGSRSRAWLSQVEDWLMARQRTIAIILLFVFGVLLSSDGLSKLI
jgi:hypothetical protein